MKRLLASAALIGLVGSPVVAATTHKAGATTTKTVKAKTTVAKAKAPAKKK